MKFKNIAKKIEPRDWQGNYASHYYSYNQPSPYLYLWSRLFQTIVSLSATKILTNKWHTGHCGIYKCEGGCRLPGIGDLVLLNDHCYLNNSRYHSKKDRKIEEKCAQLISHIVLHWNPNDPVATMIVSASAFIGVRSRELQDAIENGKHIGDAFSGDALNRFFSHNPFSKFPIDRKYQRFCLMYHNGNKNFTKKEVSQFFSDEDLGNKLLKEMQEASRREGEFGMHMMCCNPDRHNGELRFWVNNGQFYGWYIESDIYEIIRRLKNDESLDNLMARS